MRHDNTESNGTRPSVLVMHEDEVIRESYGSALRRHGCNVQTVRDGTSALSLLKNSAFDVLVTDLHESRDDGIQFLQESLRVRPWMGVVVLSSGFDRQVLPKIYELGCTCVLERPVALPILCQSVIHEAQARRVLESTHYGFLADQLPDKPMVIGGEMETDGDTIRFNLLSVAGV